MRIGKLTGTVLVATALLIGNAYAATAPRPSLVEATSSIDPLLRDAQTYAAQTGLPVALVYRTVKMQGAVGQLQQDVQRKWPATFGGLWIDQKTGTVQIAFTKDAAANVASLGGLFAEPSLLRPVTVAHSYADLMLLQQRMIADQKHGARFAGLKGTRYNIDVDVTRNQPVVYTDGHTAATVAAFTAKYGALRLEASGTGGPHACTATDCKHFLRSGLQAQGCCYFPHCSLAFTVSSGAVNLEIMTAGHCDGQYNQSHGSEQFGHLHDSQYSGTVDAAVYYVDTNGFKAGPWIYVSTGETTRKVTSMQTYAGLVVGSTICKSGWASGYTCGQVLSKTYAADGLTNLMHTDMCDTNGDSGAGIFIGGQAVGIIHGGSASGCPSGYRGWHTHIENDVNALVSGLLVVTSDSAPFFSSITATGTVGTGGTITAKFSKPVRCITVSSLDFTVRVQAQSGIYAVTSTGCTSDSNSTVTLNVNRPLIKGTSISVSINSGTIQDPGGQGVGASTRTTTVA